MSNQNENNKLTEAETLSKSDLSVLLCNEYFTKIKALNQIGYLESQQPKEGYEFHFSLFFKSKISDRKRLLDAGNLVLFVQSGLISVGNLENVTSKFKRLSFHDFTDEVTVGT